MATLEHVEASDMRVVRAVADTVRFFAPCWRRTYWGAGITHTPTLRIYAQHVTAPDPEGAPWSSSRT